MHVLFINFSLCFSSGSKKFLKCFTVCNMRSMFVLAKVLEDMIGARLTLVKGVLMPDSVTEVFRSISKS